MVEKISVQIALDGGAEVEKQLVDIGEAGAKAFEGVNEAGAAAAEGINKAGDASQKTGEDLKGVEAGANKASESLSKVSLESIKTGAEIAKIGAEIAKLGVEIGLAVARHKTLAESLFKLATGANTAVRAIGLLAPELTAAAAVIAPFAAAVAGAVIGFEAIEKAATAAAAGFEKLNHSLQMLATSSGQSFESLQQGKAAFEQLGISGEKFNDIMTKVGEKLGGIDIGGELKKSADEAEAALLKVRQAQDALFQAQTSDQLIAAQKQLADAYGKTGEAAANSIGKILGQVKALEAGQKGVTFDSLVKGETIINAVALSMKEAAGQGQNADQVLRNFIANADKLTAIKVGAAFGITAEDVDRIRRLGTALGEVKISPEATAAFERMRTAIQENERASVRLKQALSFPGFAAEAAKLSAALNIIGAAVKNLATNAVEGFGRFVSGAAQIESVKQLLQDLQSVINNFSWGNFASAAASAGSALGWLTPAGLAAKAMGALFGQAVPPIQQTGQALAQAGQSAAQAGQAFQIVKNPFTGMPEAIGATNQALQQTSQVGAQVAQKFQQIASTPLPPPPDPTPWQMIKQGATDAATAVGDFASKLGTITWDAISGVGVAAWNALTGAIQSAIDKLLQFVGIKGKGGGAATAKADGGQFARGGLLGGRGTGTSDSNLAWLSRGEYIMPARAVRQPGVLSFLEAMRRSGGIPGFASGGAVGLRGPNELGRLADALEQAGNAIHEAMVALIGSMEQAFSTMISSTKQTLAAHDASMKQIQDQILNVAGSLSKLAGYARGGLLGGRGSGTSDSNLAWVSRGEHIMPARAVAQPGVLAFLEALRRSGGNLSRVLDGMGRFALGGMVPRAIPAFATGGLAGGMSNVTIQFPGLPPISGLRASSGVVDELHRAAALAQVRSGGRKPSRYS